MVLIPAGYGQVNFIMGGPGLPHGAEVVFGFQRNPEIEAPSVDAIAMHSIFRDAFLPRLCNTVGLRSTKVKWGPTATGPSYEHTFANAGAVTLPQGPPQVCFLLRKETEFGGRAGRGRTYLPGVAEAVVDPAGIISAGSVSDLTADCTEFLEAFLLRGTRLMLLHGAGSPLEAPTAITSMSCDARAATQRRRLRR